jgi:SAM-dependent methyltransferase
VRRGYDSVSHSYRDDAGQAATGAGRTDHYQAWVDELASLVRPGARVLDLGCGAGVPATKQLVAAGLDVLGIDISEVQIERARRLVPGAEFIQADAANWDAEPGSFDAVVSFYALIHIPIEDQKQLLPHIRGWLKPSGYLLGIFGHGRWTGIEEYLGAEMFWDHADIATSLEWLARADLKPLWHRFIPEGTGGHDLVLARAGG